MDDEYSPLLTVGKMEQLVYLFSTVDVMFCSRFGWQVTAKFGKSESFTDCEISRGFPRR